jgi:hypothetical protein
MGELAGHQASGDPGSAAQGCWPERRLDELAQLGLGGHEGTAPNK